MLNKRVQSELDDFFSKLEGTPNGLRTLTSSAFSQSRDKMLFTAFSSVCWLLVDFYYKSFSFKRYYGYRLVAIDGSIFSLPRTKATIEEFGENVWKGNQATWIKSQVSFAFDVLNNICVDAEIAKFGTSENSLASKHLSRLGRGNLYLFDRGYRSKNLLWELSQSGCQFCLRVKENGFMAVKYLEENQQKDILTTIETNKGEVQVRVTKLILDCGEVEYLISSLFDMKRFSPAKLKALYHLRWGVEEHYKDMKYAIAAENFSGKKPNSIKQEFFAKILFYNISMMLCKPLIDKRSNKKRKNKKYRYKTNKRALLSKVKQCFILLFYRIKDVDKVIEDIVDTVSKESVPIRENRKYKRGGVTRKAKPKPQRAYIMAV